MKQEESENSDELSALQEVTEEIASHAERLAQLQARGSLADVLPEEMASTVLPLLKDFTAAQLAHSVLIEEWLANVEDAVEDGGSTPDLSDEEIELFKFLLARLRDFLQGALSQAADAAPELRAGFLTIEVKLNMGEKILERLTSDGEEEDDSEEGSEGDEDDGDDSED